MTHYPSMLLVHFTKLRRALQALPWRSILLFDVLLVACSLASAKIATALHELGHISTAYSLGRDVYAIVVAPLLYSGDYAGRAFYSLYPSRLPADVLINATGVLINLLTGTLVFILVSRIRLHSAWRALGTVFAGISILYPLSYIVFGYYAGYGDFSGWRKQFKPWGDCIWPVLILICPIVAYYTAKLYLSLQEAWIPSRHLLERLLIFLFTIGVLVCGSLFLPLMLKMAFIRLLVWPVYGAGAVAAVCRLKPIPHPGRRINLRVLTLPVLLVIIIEAFLVCTDGVIRFPSRKHLTTSAVAYQDEAVISLREWVSGLDIDERGHIYWVDYENRTLTVYRPEARKPKVLLQFLAWPAGLRIRGDGAYIVECGEEREEGRISYYDVSTGEFRVILSNLDRPRGVDVDKNGDVFFTQKAQEVCVLRHGEEEPTVLRDDLNGASDLVLDGSGGFCVAIARPGGAAENGGLVRVSKDGRKRETVAIGLSTPKGLDIDNEGNVYIAGAGHSSITLIPRGRGAEPICLRGNWWVDSLALSGWGDIYYACGEKRGTEIRVLRPKRRERQASGLDAAPGPPERAGSKTAAPPYPAQDPGSPE